jgi:C1A family cysteine protease
MRTKCFSRLFSFTLAWVFVLAIAHGASTGSSHESRLAPVNPAFVQHMVLEEWGRQGTSSGEEEHGLGYVPSYMDKSHLRSEVAVDERGVLGLPSRFDWRSSKGFNGLTPVKHQMSCGACWAFAQLGAVEAFNRITKPSHPTVDLSENNMVSCHWPWLNERCSGAPFETATSYLVGLARRTATSFGPKGALAESRDPYDPLFHDDALCGDAQRPTPKVLVSGFRWIVGDTPTLKKAIYANGPVASQFFFDETHIDEGYVYYYPACTAFPNHAVLLVGWDDGKVHPGGKGCWIVKNSWGSGWGKKGYFYIAYGSGNLGYNNDSVSYVSLRPYDPRENIYMEDLPGMTSAMGDYQGSSAYGAIVFTVPNVRERLTHVDFNTSSNGTRYEIQVFGTVTGSEWYVSFAGALASASGKCREMGYYSIALPAPVTLKGTKTRYAVQVKFTNPDGSPPLPIALANQYIDPSFVGKGTALSYYRYGESGGFKRPGAGASIAPVSIRARTKVVEESPSMSSHLN